MPTSRSESARASSSTSRQSSRANSDARDNILNMLKDDHKRAKKAFRDFEKLDPHDDEACEALVSRTLSELEVHAELEEDIVYPAARSALSEESLIDEAEVEHMTFKMLIAQLKEMDASDEKYSATFKVLGEYLKHHIKEEEGEIFQGLSRARMNWGSLWDDVCRARQDLMVRHGIQDGQQEQSPGKPDQSAESDSPHKH